MTLDSVENTAPSPHRPFPRTALRTPAGSSSLARLRDLLDRRRRWTSLESAFYADAEIFAHDIAGIFDRHWFFAASVAEIPEPGDFVTIDVGDRSVILIRDDDGGVNALRNVCRHRGARVLTEPSGSVGNLVCAYHSWTYGRDGSLLHAAAAGPEFDPSCFGLRRVHSMTVAGLIFLCLAPEPPTDFAEVAEIFAPFAEPHDIPRTKVAHQQEIIEQGNWKLVMENNRECYHCDGHPELACSYFTTWGLAEHEVPAHQMDIWHRSVLADHALRERCERYGIPWEVYDAPDAREAGIRMGRDALDGAGESFSATGRRLSEKLLGDLPDFRLGDGSLHLQPNCWFHLLADHVITFAAFPMSENRTLVRTTWLVADDAVEGVDYRTDELTHVWRQTNLQDAEFVALTQRGVSDPGYLPGPYTPTEHQVEAFVNWYTTRMQEYAR